MVLRVSSVVGNIYSDIELQKKLSSQRESGNFEVLQLSRTDMEKHQMRKTTDRGTDLGIVLDSGLRLKHGDVLNTDNLIIVEQLKEKVAALSVAAPGEPDRIMEVFVLVGHAIGNRHRPISIQNGRIYFPIRDDTEIDVFKGVLRPIMGDLKFEVDEIIFVPHDGMNVHEH